MLVAVCSDRGAPGTTTVALTLASACDRPSVVVEADPYGGDLAVRCRVDGDPLPPTPTVLGLGAGIAPVVPVVANGPHLGQDGTAGGLAGEPRRLDLWRDGSHQLSDLVRVVPGFLTAEQGASLSWPAVATSLVSRRLPVFADLGRIHAGSPSVPIAAAADVLVPVCRGDATSVQHLIWRLEHLVPAIAERNGHPPIVVPVVIASRRNGARAAAQVAALLAETRVGPTIAGVGWLAWDPGAVVRLVEGGDPRQRPLRTSPLLTSARPVVGLLNSVTELDPTDPHTDQHDHHQDAPAVRALRARRLLARLRPSPAPETPAETPAEVETDGSDEELAVVDSDPPDPGVVSSVPDKAMAPANSHANGHVNGRVNRHVNGAATARAEDLSSAAVKGTAAGVSFQGLRRRATDARTDTGVEAQTEVGGGGE